MRMMMAVAFTVGSNVHELRGVALGIETADQAAGQVFSVEQQSFKCDRGGEGAVIEQQANRAAGGQIANVRSSGVDAILQVDPLKILFDTQLPGLRRSQHRELDALGAEDFQSFQIDGGFRKPHASRGALKAALKIFYAPPDLSALIAPVGQWQEAVLLCLG